MSRYIIGRQKPKAVATPRGDSFWDDRMVQPLGHPAVFVSDPVDTGLLDKDGNRLFRVPDEIGYLPTKKD